jgi:hypothetical protein
MSGRFSAMFAPRSLRQTLAISALKVFLTQSTAEIYAESAESRNFVFWRFLEWENLYLCYV